jgi:hypothetical protein
MKTIAVNNSKTGWEEQKPLLIVAFFGGASARLLQNQESEHPAN